MNPIKPKFKTEILPILLIILAVVSSFYFYSNFPEQVPIHWNIAGEADDWGSKATAAFLFPVVILGMYLLFFLLPFLDPKKERYEQFKKTYHVFKNIIVFFMVGIYFISSMKSIGYHISIELWIPILVGLLFIIMGNYMSKLKPNWFIGIRNPWTLSSEEVWNKTHRLGGKIFIVGGLLMSLMGFLPVAWRLPLFFVILALVILGTTIYSYLVFSQLKKK